MMTLNISRMNKIQDFHTDPEFPPRSGRIAEAFNIMQTDYRYVKKAGASSFLVKINEIARKHLILCSSISDKWQKTLKTLIKVAGPVGKEGVVNVKNTASSTFAVKNHRNHYKTPYFML